MPGWKDEMDFDQIEGYAQRVVNNDGRHEYEKAYGTGQGNDGNEAVSRAD